MSTRCQIGIYHRNIKNDKIRISCGEINFIPDVLIYSHYDGDPAYTGKFIKDFLHLFNKDRGKDIEYLSAQLIYRLMYKANNGKTVSYTGFGIDRNNNIHSDINYFYAIGIDCMKTYSVLHNFEQLNTFEW